MAFENRSLYVLAYSGGNFTMWHYDSYDPMDEVDGKNYFGQVWNLVSLGDLFVIRDDHNKTHLRQVVERDEGRITLGNVSE